LNILLTGNDAEFYRCADLFEKMITAAEFNARPHWGKWHTQKASQLEELYSEHWEEFSTIRSKYDPNGVFLNEYLRSKLIK